MDLYDLLGVRRGALASDIRRAYQRKARQLHPALNPGDPAAAERFQVIVHAFEILSDPRRRAAYDRGEEPASVSTYTEVLFEGFDFEGEKAPAAGFREIFDDGREAQTAAARGEDLEQVARLTFEESMSGARRRLNVMRHERCASCGGSGLLSLRPEQPCARCGGSGQLRARRGHMVFSRTCRACGGRGVTTERACSSCNGEGRRMGSEWIDVDIPPGAGDGSRVRLPGLGNTGPREGPPGDLTLVIEVEPHPLFKREGDDLHSVVPVTIAEAAMGAHVDVATPDGGVTIEIPAGTQSGQRFRLRKRGAPRLGGKGRGDLYVDVLVVVPTVTDERGCALLKELTQIYPDNPRKEIDHGPKS